LFVISSIGTLPIAMKVKQTERTFYYPLIWHRTKYEYEIEKGDIKHIGINEDNEKDVLLDLSNFDVENTNLMNSINSQLAELNTKFTVVLSMEYDFELEDGKRLKATYGGLGVVMRSLAKFKFQEHLLFICPAFENMDEGLYRLKSGHYIALINVMNCGSKTITETYDSAEFWYYYNLGKVASQIILELASKRLLHCINVNDYHIGMACYFTKKNFPKIPIMLTVHNAAYQGQFIIKKKKSRPIFDAFQHQQT
jgi:hypothetical protein